MKFLIVGESHPWSAESSYARGLKNAGQEVLIWNNKSPVWWLGKKDWWSMNPAIRGVYDLTASVSFWRFATKWKPDVLFIPKGENIHSYAVKRVLRSTGARLIVWYPDHPFKDNMTSMNVLRNLKRCEIFYIWGKFLIETIEAAGCPDVRYLPFAFDPDMHRDNVDISEADRKRFGCEISFVGAWDEERQRDLELLAAFDLAIWGPGWRCGLPPSSPLASKVRGDGLYNEELVKAYRCSKLVFNHLRAHNGSAHNMRTMEIAGIGGGAQLVRRTPEQASELFVEGEEIFCFDSLKDETDAIRELLGNDLLLRSASQKARDRVARDHLISHRIASILEDLKTKKPHTP